MYRIRQFPQFLFSLPLSLLIFPICHLLSLCSGISHLRTKLRCGGLKHLAHYFSFGFLTCRNNLFTSGIERAASEHEVQNPIFESVVVYHEDDYYFSPVSCFSVPATPYFVCFGFECDELGCWWQNSQVFLHDSRNTFLRNIVHPPNANQSKKQRGHKMGAHDRKKLVSNVQSTAVKCPTKPQKHDPLQK